MKKPLILLGLLSSLLLFTHQKHQTSHTQVLAQDLPVMQDSSLETLPPNTVPPTTAPPTTVTTEHQAAPRASRSARRTTPPVTAPTVKKAVVPAVTSAPGGVWACIRQHESGGNYASRSSNGHYGAYQFSPATWNATVKAMGPDYAGYANGRADLAPPAVQDAAAIYLQAHSGWTQWSTHSLCGV